MTDDIIYFTREKDYRLTQSLGQGACGKTVLLRDEIIGEDFVCKKYSPCNSSYKEQYFKNFLAEIKVLHRIYHANIVRVFNYYLYPKRTTGYILMEYVKGHNINEHLHRFPENINEVFSQLVEGFGYLEENGILHRDIRPQNIMVTNDGIVKIIDFGFSKKIESRTDFDKSVSLNWLYPIPEEFKYKEYSYQTEVYFIGKLFEKIIKDENISHFKYGDIVSRMCEFKPSDREKSFKNVKTKILGDKFEEINFDETERAAYIDFSSSIKNLFVSIIEDAKYLYDIESIHIKLKNLYKKVMLEDYLPHGPSLINCFLEGEYRYNKVAHFSIGTLENFLKLLGNCTKEKNNIILNNLHSRLDSIERYSRDEDDIPF